MGALIASLFAVGASPTGAAEIKAGDDNEAEATEGPSYSACVGDAEDDAGFSDLPDDEAFSNAINCMAYYGITAGSTTTTYSPGDDVHRWQMALFLYNAAGVAGVDLSGMTDDQGLSDLDGLNAFAQDRINAVVEAGIMSASDDAFSPNDPMTRAAMAVSLVALVRKADGSLFDTNGTLKQSGELDYFADARASEPRAVDTAISQAYELEITAGTSDTTFSPNASVKRGSMAVFITAALAHTNARPAGVTVQLDDTGSARVSVRSDQFAPVANVRVDAFWREADRSDEVLDDDGTCSRLARSVHSGATACQIDSSDRRTDGVGNVLIPGTINASKGAVVWAWTGDSGDSFDADTTDFARLDVGATPAPVPATSATVGSDRAEGIMVAEFGDEVTFSVQLQGISNARAVDVGPPEGGASYRLLVNNPDGTAEASVLKVASDGSASFVLSWADPNAREPSDAQTVSFVLSPLPNARGTVAPDCDTVDGERGHCRDADISSKHQDDGRDTDEDDTAYVDPDTEADNHEKISGNDENADGYPDSFIGSMDFDDGERMADAISVDTGSGYAAAPARGSANNSLTVTVTDQYGNGLGNIPVKLGQPSTVDDNAMYDQYVYTTNSAGEVAISYDYSGNVAATQTINAFVADAEGEKPALDPIQDDVMFFWVQEPTLSVGVSTSTETDQRGVIGGDLEINTIIVAESVDVLGPTVVTFDGNDQFTVVQAGDAEGAGTRYGMEAFVAALGSDASLSGKGTQEVTVSWGSYDPTDSARVTQWTLNLTVND